MAEEQNDEKPMTKSLWKFMVAVRANDKLQLLSNEDAKHFNTVQKRMITNEKYAYLIALPTATVAALTLKKARKSGLAATIFSGVAVTFLTSWTIQKILNGGNYNECNALMDKNPQVWENDLIKGLGRQRPMPENFKEFQKSQMSQKSQ